MVGLHASYSVDPSLLHWARTAKISLNVTNVGNTKGVETANVTSASGGYTYYPIAPTQGFVTLQATF
jgi:outer membrane receptor protein involved in Fe transport